MPRSSSIYANQRGTVTPRTARRAEPQEPGRGGGGGAVVVRVVLGLLLIVAAVLKYRELTTRATPEEGLFSSRPLLAAFVEIELLQGLWLLSGLAARAAWGAALVGFSIFAIVAGYKVSAGDDTCGCFGQLMVNPKWTLALDLAAVAALLRWRPAPDDAPPPGATLRAAALAVVALAFGVPSAVAMIRYQPPPPPEAGPLGANPVVVLDPAQWIDKPFPLVSHIYGGDALESGRWTVVLYRNDCTESMAALPRYDQAARQSAGNDEAPRVALIEIPPYALDGPPVPWDSQCLHLRLAKSREWVATTPLSLSLVDGIVTAVPAPPPEPAAPTGPAPADQATPGAAAAPETEPAVEPDSPPKTDQEPEADPAHDAAPSAGAEPAPDADPAP